MLIQFEYDTPYGLFRDALHFPDDKVITDEEVEALKQERLNNWIAIVSNPPIEGI